MQYADEGYPHLQNGTFAAMNFDVKHHFLLLNDTIFSFLNSSFWPE
ncbi:hypothetical protein BD65_706 [Yersinia ruckeri]|nr:hypothetical protein BD65_706 [Yersinia ruckeri]